MEPIEPRTSTSNISETVGNHRHNIVSVKKERTVKQKREKGKHITLEHRS